MGASRLTLNTVAPTPNLKANWSSQDLVETLSAHFMSRFELLGANPTDVAMTSGAIVERLDVVGHVSDREFTVLVDLFLDSLFLQSC